MEDSLEQQTEHEQEDEAWADLVGIDISPSNYRATCQQCW